MDASNATLPTQPAAAASKQPGALAQMSVTSPAPATGKQHCAHDKARRVRGGGAARDCFLGALDCFICFETCRACCECLADIVCCPCEMCGL